MNINKVDNNVNHFQNDNLNKLAQIFPSVVKDGEVDFKALKEELGLFSEVSEENTNLLGQASKMQRKWRKRMF